MQQQFRPRIPWNLASLLMVPLAIGYAAPAGAEPGAPPGVTAAPPLPAPEPTQGGFGAQWNLVVGLEDLAMVGYAWEPPPDTSMKRGLGTATGWETTEYRTWQEVSGVWSMPRLSLDLFVLPNLSVGVAGRMAVTTHRITTRVTVESSDAPPQHAESTSEVGRTTATLSPRVGYGLLLAQGIGAWGRAGLDLNWCGGDYPEGAGPWAVEQQGWSQRFTLEALLVLAPLPHTLLAVGPTYRTAGSRQLLAVTLNAGLEI